MNKETFLSEVAFAKLVYTPEGPGILVAGEVFRVVPPAGADLHQREPFAEWVVSALRSGPREISGSVTGLSNTYGVLSSAVGKAGAA